MSSNPALRTGQGTARGPAILSLGFRPFFLAASIYAGLGVAIWMPFYSGQIAVPTAMSALDWHIHEMLYGFLPGVIAGFLLTAIPNWTGRPPLRGAGLAMLALLWLAGRVAVFFSAKIGPLTAGLTDCAFLLLLAAWAAREVVASRNWRNAPPILVLLVLFAGNLTFHIEDHLSGASGIGGRLGVSAAIMLIALIGGRVVPNFTRNWLARENPGRLPAPSGRLDGVVLVISALAFAAWVGLPHWRGTAALLLVAGIAQALRLARWAGVRAWRERLVLILHVAYAFVPLGFLLAAGAVAAPQTIPLTAGVHAWTGGAIGVMTLAIMTRASLGHTGRPLAANGPTQALYAFSIAAAATRIVAPFAPQAGLGLLHAAAGLWIAGFWTFAIAYGPLLWRPRSDLPG